MREEGRRGRERGGREEGRRGRWKGGVGQQLRLENKKVAFFFYYNFLA